MKEQFVLDASALLCILFDERGQERVNQIVDRSRIHAVNLAEVIGRLIRSRMPGEKVTRTFQLRVAEFLGAGQRWANFIWRWTTNSE